MTGDEIRAARERAGLTQQQLGAAVGVGLRTVGNWERGTTVPRNRLAMLESVLGRLDSQEPAPLRAVSDVELLAEIARRFARRAQQEDGEGHADSSAPKTPAGASPAPARPTLSVVGGNVTDTEEDEGELLAALDDDGAIQAELEGHEDQP